MKLGIGPGDETMAPVHKSIDEVKILIYFDKLLHVNSLGLTLLQSLTVLGKSGQVHRYVNM